MDSKRMTFGKSIAEGMGEDVQVLSEEEKIGIIESRKVSNTELIKMIMKYDQHDEEKISGNIFFFNKKVVDEEPKWECVDHFHHAF